MSFTAGANRTKLGLKVGWRDVGRARDGGRQSNQAGIESKDGQAYCLHPSKAPIEPSWD